MQLRALLLGWSNVERDRCVLLPLLFCEGNPKQYIVADWWSSDFEFRNHIFRSNWPISVSEPLGQLLNCIHKQSGWLVVVAALNWIKKQRGSCSELNPKTEGVGHSSELNSKTVGWLLWTELENRGGGMRLPRAHHHSDLFAEHECVACAGGCQVPMHADR